MPILTTLNGPNQFTGAHEIGFQTHGGIGFNLVIAGTFVGALTIQLSYDRGITWFDVKDYTAPDAEIGEQFEVNVLVRIGFKAGNFTSGAATVRIGSGAVRAL